MEQKEKSAIDSCMVDICDTLKQAVVALVDHMSNLNLISDEERDLIEEIKTKEGKVAQVMRMLKAKDDSFDSLVAYFEKKGHKKLVAKLRDLAGKSVQ